MSRRFVLFAAMILCILSPRALLAKIPEDVMKAVEGAYPPGIEHPGLFSAHQDLDLSKMHGFVVLQKGGIPAERAHFYLSWEEYDYRGVVVHLDKDSDVTTRRGEIYAYLQPGDVMAVAGIKEYGNTIYLKLITTDVYVPMERELDKHHSRVTVMLGFDFPKEMLAQGPEAVLAAMSEWVKPFANVDEAMKFAKGLQAETMKAQGGQPVKGEPGVTVSRKPATGEKAAASEGAAIDSQTDAERMKSLEDKIDAAKKQLDEAEKQLGQVKSKNNK